ncbi:chemotaxis response regulator protein-glutamate methylesterase [Clostridium sp. D2Q-14]|uniref:protein-glutamate methylesterase/protein-glutamine glutaminase n=1 Tax=Anaeromonas gelatinilytica TaxID=2683194 RepID=UPI00193B5FEF|nr:chemotaxis response regulator protein-glutamate methylesterase [Anaeromonas gelatinilytica]MBS4536031.1 chemotaxis response regulator protein-glutamate methylesterase [Anaeromonas gelatinilytica]
MKKVFIVDDSAFMRKIISDMVNKDDDLMVVGTAKNGKEAIQKIDEIDIDIITLDIEMPKMNGIETLKKLKEKNINIPILMLSSFTKQGAELTLKALEMGAIDFITKPSNVFSIETEGKNKELINKIKLVTKSKRIDMSTVKTKKCNIEEMKKTYDSRVSNIVGIGCSTGGPRALQEIIPRIPKGVNGSFLVVQHMPPGFTRSLADRMNNISNIIVKEAEDGEILKNGYCYVAPGAKHLIIIDSNNKFKIKLDDGKNVNGHKPSVDVLFNSIANFKNVNKIGVILTGMGSDGALGLKKIVESGGYSIGQDEKTCVIYGMPKVAYDIGIINIQLPLENIIDELNNKLGVL